MVPLEILVRARSWRSLTTGVSIAGGIRVCAERGDRNHTEHYAPFRLERGESAYFDSSMRHLYVSVSKDSARVLSVSHDPGSREHISRFMNPSARQIERPEE